LLNSFFSSPPVIPLLSQQSYIIPENWKCLFYRNCISFVTCRLIRFSLFHIFLSYIKALSKQSKI
jgi:hypothetical protein